MLANESGEESEVLSDLSGALRVSKTSAVDGRMVAEKDEPNRLLLRCSPQPDSSLARTRTPLSGTRLVDG